MTAQLKPAIILFTLLTLITGAIYPALVTGLVQVLFPRQANGSLLAAGDGRTIGSELIGQSFSQPNYFWGRPSATLPYPYNAGASSGSNLGPTNPALVEAVKLRIAALKDADPGNNALVPVDLVTASGSGLDPHISPSAALYQLNRVARARHLDQTKVEALIAEYTEDRQWLILGEPRVNVLRLNLALDELDRASTHSR